MAEFANVLHPDTYQAGILLEPMARGAHLSNACAQVGQATIKVVK